MKKINASQIIRVMAALGAASQWRGKSAPWAKRILSAVLGQLGVDAYGLTKLKGQVEMPDLSEMVIKNPDRSLYKLDRELAERLAENATEFWLRSACQSAIFALWQEAAREMLEGGDEMSGSDWLIHQLVEDVSFLEALFGGQLVLTVAQDEDFRPVSDLDGHLARVADGIVKARDEARERKDALLVAATKPRPIPPAPAKKKGFLARLFGG